MSVVLSGWRIGVPCDYKDNIRQDREKRFKGQTIEEVSSILCHQFGERVLEVTVDNKINIYTHYADFDSGYVVGITYRFNKTNGKLTSVKVI